MAIYKAPVRENFTIIPNETHRDTSLSLQARGLLGYFLSLPDDWVIRPEHAAKENGIGRNTAYKIIKELREAGYILKVENRSSEGKFSSGDYLVFRSQKDATEWLEAPENKGLEPCVKKRYAVERHTVERQLSKKELKKEKTTTTGAESKISISDFSGLVKDQMKGSGVPEWFVLNYCHDLHEQYKIPRVAMAVKIIWSDWSRSDIKVMS